MSKSDDVGTTLRKRLTPRERLALFERERGLCAVCGLKIRGKFIDEHARALGLGGSNDPSNRKIAHPRCAAIKTREQDMPRINKAKAQKRAHHGLKAPKGSPLASRNDLPSKDAGKASKAHERVERLLPPRRGGIAAQFGIVKGKSK